MERLDAAAHAQDGSLAFAFLFCCDRDCELRTANWDWVWDWDSRDCQLGLPYLVEDYCSAP